MTAEIPPELAQRYLFDAAFHARVMLAAECNRRVWPDSARRDRVDAAILAVAALEEVDRGGE